MRAATQAMEWAVQPSSREHEALRSLSWLLDEMEVNRASLERGARVALVGMSLEDDRGRSVMKAASLQLSGGGAGGCS